jgi:hypothetical protein
MSLVLAGSTSGSVTLQEPAIAGTTVLDLPATSGTVVVTGTTPTLNGITFPATQVPSANANTLDDYEEGTWTPVVTAATGSITSYTVQSATYTKIGRSVTVNVQFTITNNGTGAFRIDINNSLPFSTLTSPDVAFHGAGRENSAVGFMVMVQCSGLTMRLWKTDNTYPGGTNYVLFATCTYFTS